MPFTDNTIVVTYWAEHQRNPPPCTWAEFKDANRHLGDAVLDVIASTIENCHMVWQDGGGAQGEWFVRRAETLDALTKEYQTEIEKRGLPHISADELLVQIIGEPDTKPEDVHYIRTFIARWEGAEMAERARLS
jgi:hypothetical protein